MTEEVSNTTEGTTELRVKRVELKIAIATIAGTLLISAVTLIHNLVDAAKAPVLQVNDSGELRQLLSMPLEGTWRFSFKYDEFHSDRDQDWRAEGRATIIWKPESSAYELLLGAKVYGLDESNPNNEAVSAFLIKATIPSDSLGIPKDPRVSFTYVHSMSREGFRARADHYFEMSFEKGTRPDELTVRYSSDNTRGEGRLLRD